MSPAVRRSAGGLGADSGASRSQPPAAASPTVAGESARAISQRGMPAPGSDDVRRASAAAGWRRRATVAGRDPPRPGRSLPPHAVERPARGRMPPHGTTIARRVGRARCPVDAGHARGPPSRGRSAESSATTLRRRGGAGRSRVPLRRPTSDDPRGGSDAPGRSGSVRPAAPCRDRRPARLPSAHHREAGQRSLPTARRPPSSTRQRGPPRGQQAVGRVAGRGRR